MVTKKQHYYPRCLLKHFSDSQGNVNVYIHQANKLTKMKYENICVANYTYESGNTNDNILERKLGVYESKACPIVNYILNNIDLEQITITEEQQQILFQYMFLQSLRTDAGRINFINLIEDHFSYEPRNTPIELDEIKDSGEKIKKFNWIFKQENVLEEILKELEKSEEMNFHIAISQDNLLTSDNPIIGTDEGRQIILPISPHFCIEFQHDSINCSKDLIVILKPEKTRYINEATINTSNYYIISREPFNLIQNNYIYNRFLNKDWTIGFPHIS
ncbi:DUF4238 domain-containing protein [Staphylococcus haemolyticus]|uniref:DUF4238 domain-containing protein n=1 Tax=Staphylococcus haemolyticus TaxID=1283 RepID=UPI001F0A3DD6|nr:DUF4238 domain-containing protein [Staphylococcus haemolyticus]MCH4475753.1 DUF4238 domain-containing protein [Staphylococcus haemolyticus]MCH4518042.1 DUF4238 domain-containing protein [Staphylococcus haemolyticus]